MKRKLLSLLIAFCLIISLLPVLTPVAKAATWLEGGFSTGWYTGQGPYYIASAADLAGLSALVDGGESFEGKEFVLTGNIDLSGRDWVPIGTGVNAFKRFRGSFDGGGFTISGMRISGTYTSAGLFGYVENGHIANLTIDSSCSINCGGTNVGSIAGASLSVIDNCANYAAIRSAYDGGSANVGGIVGFSGAGGAVLNCTNDGSVFASGRSRKNVGGVAGYNKGRMERCVNVGAVSSACGGSINNAGGLVGFENDGTTQNCYSRADVSVSGGSENNAGGIAGRFSTSFGKLQNCYSTGKIKASGGQSTTGGIIGKKLVGTVFYCYYKKSGDLTGIGGEADRKGFTTAMSGAQMTAVPGDVYGAWSEVSVDGYNLGGASLVDAMNRGIVDVPEIWTYDPTENDQYPIIAINNWTDKGEGKYYYADFSWVSGAGSEEEPYIISNGAQLAGLSALVNAEEGEILLGIDPKGEGRRSSAAAQSFEGKHIKLSDDIVLDKRLWTPIGTESRPFKGSFDGDGYTVFNMNIGSERVNADFEFNGLFGCSAGTIRNLSVGEGSTVFASGEEVSRIFAAGVVGLNKGVVSGCQNHCSIAVFDGGELYLGGIAGKSWGREAKIERCCNEGTASADMSINEVKELCGIGGIAGITGRETKQEDCGGNEDKDCRNGIFSCTNAGKTEVIVRGSSAKVLLGGIAGGNVLVKNQSVYANRLSMAADGNYTAFTDSEELPEYSAEIINCSNIGSSSLTMRASGAKTAVGGIVGGNVLALAEGKIRDFFENEGVNQLGEEKLDLGFDLSNGYKRFETKGCANVKNCFSAGAVATTFSKGDKLSLGGVIGLCSADGTEIESCYYDKASIKSGSVGIGGTEADSDEQCKSQVHSQITGLAGELNAWVEANDKKLSGWWSNGSDYPCLSCKVYYNTKGGEKGPVDNRIYAIGDSVRVSFKPQPVMQDYIFKGWSRAVDSVTAEYVNPSKDAGNAEKLKAEKTNTITDIKGDVVLYAVWESNTPKSKENFVDTKKNEDGSTTVSNSTKTVAANGNITTETTETITDEKGKVLSTKTISSVYDSVAKTTTERIKEKPAGGKSINTASFIMEDASKITALPEELSKELRAAKLESLTLEDKTNGTSAVLGWETDENGRRLGQTAKISSDNNDGRVKLSKALLDETRNGAYKSMNIIPAAGMRISLDKAALSKLEDSSAEPELSMKLEGNIISIGGDAKGIEVGAVIDYEPAKPGSIVVAETTKESGDKARVLGKYADGSLSIKALCGEAYEIFEIDFPFTDVAEDDWFNSAVREMFGSGLMTGISETEFAPKATASRAMVVTLLWRMEGSPESRGQSGFADVAADAWYAKAAAWASENGIVNGVSKTTFAPDMAVSREMLVTILFRLQKYDGDLDELSELSSFSDGGSVSDYAFDAMRWACDSGVITGRADGRLDPLGVTSRSELAAVMVRYFDM